MVAAHPVIVILQTKSERGVDAKPEAELIIHGIDIIEVGDEVYFVDLLTLATTDCRAVVVKMDICGDNVEQGTEVLPIQ